MRKLDENEYQVIEEAQSQIRHAVFGLESVMHLRGLEDQLHGTTTELRAIIDHLAKMLYHERHRSAQVLICGNAYIVEDQVLFSAPIRLDGSVEGNWGTVDEECWTDELDEIRKVIIKLNSLRI